MRAAAVVCVLALAFAAFAVTSAAAINVEMVEAELVDADHPALIAVRARRRGIDKTVKPLKGKGGKAKKSAKTKQTKTKAPKAKAPKFNGNTGIAGGLPGSSPVPGQKRIFGTGAKGGQKADGWTGEPKGAKGKKKVVKGPKPGKDSKTIGGHGTGAFGGQESDGWNPNAGERAVNKDAGKFGPIGGAYSKLFGHPQGKGKGKGNGKFNGPLTGLPPQYRNKNKGKAPQSGNTGITGGLPIKYPKRTPDVPENGNTGIVPPFNGPLTGLPPQYRNKGNGNTGIVPPGPLTGVRPHAI